MSTDILVSLGHFCDKHGPSVVMVTQVDNGGNHLLMPSYPTESYCSSCSLQFPESLQDNIRSLRTSVDSLSFISTQYSTVRYNLLNLIVKKAFSEETMVYDGSPMVFHDDVRGANLLIGFKLSDQHARGNERRYCLIFTIDSKNHAKSMKIFANNWDFILQSFNKMIEYIKNCRANIQEELNDTQNNLAPYLRANKIKLSRNLVDLTKDSTIFLRLHKWNTYILHNLHNSIAAAATPHDLT